MSHDQLMKDLLRTFFADILVLFFPGIASRIDTANITFLDPQTFLDIPRGQSRTADLVARVEPLTGIPAALSIHVEVQSQSDSTLPDRMWTYNASLINRTDQPTISMVIWPFATNRRGRRVAGQVARLTRHSWTLLDQEYVRLDYWCLGLRDLDAESYASGDSLIGVALAALMRPGPAGKVGLKLTIMGRLGAARIDEARRELLINCVQTYLTLNAAEQEEYMRRARAERGGAVEATELTWADRMRQEGREQARLEVRRDDVYRVAQSRFGALPDDAEARLATLDANSIERLIDRVGQVATLDELIAELM